MWARPLEWRDGRSRVKTLLDLRLPIIWPSSCHHFNNWFFFPASLSQMQKLCSLELKTFLGVDWEISAIIAVTFVYKSVLL